MKPTRIAGTKISTSLWLSFGVVLLILVATLLIYQWQFRQTSRRADTVAGRQDLQQVTWEMLKSNSDIARHLTDYIQDLDRKHIQALRDSEAVFDRATLTLNRLAPNDEIKSQGQEINRIFGELKTSADEVVSLFDHQQAALQSVRETAGDAADLMQGILAANVNDNSQVARDKLAIAIDMNRSLEVISTGIENYLREPDPAIRQQVQEAGADFKRLSGSYQSLSLTSLESSWLLHMDNQIEKMLGDGAELFTTGDSLSGAMTRFQSSNNEVEATITGRIQPLVNAEVLTASQALSNSITSSGVWLWVLGILAVVTGIAAVFMISRWFNRPMQKLLTGASLVASGRIEHRFNIDARGELGQLALGLNKMLDNLTRSRDALGESEELAWALLDATHDAVVLTDLRGTILASNEIAASRFSLSLEQMIDESLYDLLPAESAVSLKAHVAEVTRTRKPVHYEDEREGKIIEHDVYPVSEHKGEISRIAFFSRDVTMRKWVEDVTEQLGRRNALILESAGEGIFGLDIEGRTTFVNPAAARMHGFKPEELIGKKHHEMVHHSRPDGKLYPHELCPIHATIKDGAVHSNVDDEVFWRKDGTSFHVEYTSTPIMENGRILGAVITFRDIGDRKRVEKALRESEEKYRSVVESAASLIIWLDEKDKVIDCGPRVEQFLGYTPSEITGHQFLDIVLPADRPEVEEALRMTAKEGFKHDQHFRMLLKNGGSMEVNMNAAMAGGVSGGHSRIICMISAISQRIYQGRRQSG